MQGDENSLGSTLPKSTLLNVYALSDANDRLPKTIFLPPQDYRSKPSLKRVELEVTVHFITNSRIVLCINSVFDSG